MLYHVHFGILILLDTCYGYHALKKVAEWKAQTSCVCSKPQAYHHQAMFRRLEADGGSGVLQEAMQVLGR